MDVGALGAIYLSLLRQVAALVFLAAISAELASLTQMLADGLAEQGRSQVSAPDLAAGLLALMTGAFQLSSAAQAVMPTGYAAEAAIAYAVNGIAAAPQA